jgi:hypothetical protein
MFSKQKFTNLLLQFSEPIVKFASGVQPSPADVNKLLQSLPSLMVNVPGFGNVDVSKVGCHQIPNDIKYYDILSIFYIQQFAIS